MCNTMTFVEKQQKNFEEISLQEYVQPDLESYSNVQFLKGIIRAMITSEIAGAVNAGRDNAIRNIDGINIVAAEWSAAMELDNVCRYCQDRNGQIVSVDDPEYYSAQPPAHPFCRCIWVYITEEETSGDGQPIQTNWTPSTEEEKEKYREFDLKSIADVKMMADAYEHKMESYKKKIVTQWEEADGYEDYDFHFSEVLN